MLKVQYWSGKIINESNKIVKPRLFSASSFKRLQVLLKKLLWTPCGPKQFCQKPFSSFCLLQWWLLRAVCLITEHCHLHGLTLTNQQKKKVGCNSPFFFTLIIKFKKRLARNNSVLWTYYKLYVLFIQNVVNLLDLALGNIFILLYFFSKLLGNVNVNMDLVVLRTSKHKWYRGNVEIMGTFWLKIWGWRKTIEKATQKS